MLEQDDAIGDRREADRVCVASGCDIRRRCKIGHKLGDQVAGGRLSLRGCGDCRNGGDLLVTLACLGRVRGARNTARLRRTRTARACGRLMNRRAAAATRAGMPCAGLRRASTIRNRGQQGRQRGYRCLRYQDDLAQYHRFYYPRRVKRLPEQDGLARRTLTLGRLGANCQRRKFFSIFPKGVSYNIHGWACGGFGSGRRFHPANKSSLVPSVLLQEEWFAGDARLALGSARVLRDMGRPRWASAFTSET